MANSLTLIYTTGSSQIHSRGTFETRVHFLSAERLIAIQAVKEHTQALDKLLSSYAQLGNALPRLSALRDGFQDNYAIRQLFAFLYEDIVEFHRRVYKLIRKPGARVLGETGMKSTSN